MNSPEPTGHKESVGSEANRYKKEGKITNGQSKLPGLTNLVETSGYAEKTSNT